MSESLIKHYVTFYSPGTFVHEQSTQEIESWNVAKAVEMARSIRERHGATPFGFSFSTRKRGPEDFNSKETARSKGMYYLGGTIETLEEIEARNDAGEKTLVSNMRGNDWDRVIVNTNSWRIVQPFTDKDTLLEFTK
jgi:hypothetical protein